MARSSNVTRLRRPEPELTTAQAIVYHADKLGALAKAINHHTEQRKAADDFWEKAGGYLDATCRFFKKKAPMLLLSAPAVIVIIQGMSPNVAKLLAIALKALGAPS